MPGISSRFARHVPCHCGQGPEVAMRGRILVAVVAALAMAVAAPRNARCCEPCGSADSLILTVAAAGVRGADAFKRMSLLAQLLAAVPEVTFAGFLDAMV